MTRQTGVIGAVIISALLLASCGGDSSPKIAKSVNGTVQGTVKSWSSEEGFGAIVTNDQPPRAVWAHFSAIDVEGYKSLKPGQRVELRYEEADQDGFKYRATYVHPLK